ncbi:MAG: CBS domain-containing protein [Planctomycetes bacterium]|jgi:acetoin utilization protein AcuB|nr:CBS domain-containing protein [Planctomycetota bacterium]
MKIADLMTTKLYTVGPDDSVEGAVRMLQQRGVRHLLVLDGHDLVGIISDRDIKRALDSTKTRHKKVLNLGGLFFLLEPILVREIMTKNPTTIAGSATAQEAAKVMLANRFGALPVTKAGRLVGIVTETDLLRHFAAGKAK